MYLCAIAASVTKYSDNSLAAYRRSSALQQTAPSEEDGEKFVITHPFHPLAGEQFEALGQNSRWGDCRVWFRDAAGGVRTIPLSFTSLAPLVSAIGSPRTTLFRARDLLELAELVRAMEAAGGGEGVK